MCVWLFNDSDGFVHVELEADSDAFVHVELETDFNAFVCVKPENDFDTDCVFPLMREGSTLAASTARSSLCFKK